MIIKYLIIHISYSLNGMDKHEGSTNNKIYDNTIIKTTHPISVSSSDAAANTFYSSIIK